jgi:hypothetical protein
LYAARRNVPFALQIDGVQETHFYAAGMLMVWDDLIQSTEPMQGYVERYTVGGMAMRKQTNLSHKTKTCGLVGHCDSKITNEDDESGSWTEVVSKKKKKTDGFVKKKPYVLLTTNLGGKQSESLNKLTLFTKSN